MGDRSMIDSLFRLKQKILLIGGLFLILPRLSSADMPVSESFYPVGTLCQIGRQVTIPSLGCTFNESIQGWRCHWPPFQCPSVGVPQYGWGDIRGLRMRCRHINGGLDCVARFLSGRCPDIHYPSNMRAIGTCGCSLWLQREACGEGGCSPLSLAQVTRSTTTLFDSANIGMKWGILNFYCHKKKRTAYFLTGDEGDEGPPSPMGGGIWTYVADTHHFEQVYSTANGLLDNNSASMLIQGHAAWIMTLTGVQRLNLKTHRWSYWKVLQGKIVKPTTALPTPSDKRFILERLKQGRKVNIRGYLADGADIRSGHVCIELPVPVHAWVKKSEIGIRGPGFGPQKYALNGRIYRHPQENAISQRPWMYWGPGCPDWALVLPLKTSQDGRWAQVVDDSGLIPGDSIEPILNRIKRETRR